MADQATVESIIHDNRERFDSTETMAVEARPRMGKGQPDWNDCYIEVVARQPPLLVLPPEIAGVPIVKVAAPLEDQALRVLALTGKTYTEAELASDWRTGLLTAVVEAVRKYEEQTYQPFDPTKLVEVNENCELLLHVSPDDSWPVLIKFLSEADTYSVGMYDFTAPHIIEQFTTASKTASRVSLCLGRRESLDKGKKAYDWKEVDVIDHLNSELGDAFKFSWASTGAKRQFASAYHIKVAVKDRESFWLSSGNWQSSNQPNKGFAGASTGPAGTSGSEMGEYNREWHIVVKQEKLSGIFEDYIIKDLDTSALDDAGNEGTVAMPPPPAVPFNEDFTLEFKIQPTPMIADDEGARAHKRAFARKAMPSAKRKIMPLLTPDNYAREITKLVRKAKHRLWFQNQSLSINKFPSEAYRELLDALKEKAWEIDDCRIIMRDYRRANTIDYLRILDRDGFPMQKIRGMKNCHTKGILIDSRWTVIGSHNWTNEGTNFNRDASLIIDDAEVTKYFEEVVEHDWNSLSYPIHYDLETPVAILPLPGESIAGATERLEASLNAIDDG
jgi:hypothetical protein